MASRAKNETAVFLFSHSRNWFPDVESLSEYLDETLPGENEGKYYVVTAKFYRPIEAGDIVLFHKNRQFVGEGRVKEPLVERVVVRQKQRFEGWVTFDPRTIQVYRPTRPFSNIEEKLDKALSSRSPYEVDTEVYRLVARAR